MSEIRRIENEKKTNLLANVINNWIKENNKINTNTKNIKIQNISDWPKRSPFEFYNKNIIIPNTNNITNNIIKNNFVINKSQKLKSINDSINELITKNRNEQNNGNNNIKVSLLSQNKKTLSGSVTIKPFSNEEKPEDKIIPSINIPIHRKNYEEKNIIYDFGYSKEERLEPLKLSLNKKQVNYFDTDSESKNKNNENNVYNLTFEKKEEKNENLNIIENEEYENINEKEEVNKEPRILIVPKSEKVIKYYKEKDLFDEEIKENDLDVTKDQMDILENGIDKRYNAYNELSKQKNFEIKHPYLEYDYYKMRYKDKFENNYKRQEKLYNMLQKQKMIINNIMLRKFYINNNNINTKKLLRNKSSTNNNEQGNHLPKRYFRSYSMNDYYNENNWEKRQQMLEKKKDYSTIVLLNERRNIEERKNARLIRRIRLNEERKQMEKYLSDEEDEEYDYEKDNDDENINKLPEIKQRKFREEDKKEENIYNLKRVYTNSYNPLKKYRLKRKEGEKIVNTMMKHNPQLEQLLYNHDIYQMKLENIRKHIK